MRSITFFVQTIVVSICIFFFAQNIQAQTSKLDSLKTELENHQKQDTIRWRILYNLAFENFQSDMEKTNAYLKKAEELSSSLNYIPGKANELYLKGILESVKSNYTQSLNYFNRSLKQFESIDDWAGMATIYAAFGITHFSQSKYEEAIADYDKATELYEKAGDREDELVSLLVNKANANCELGNYNEAISMYKKVLKHKTGDQDGLEIALVHGNIGVIYYEQGNYPLALHYFNKSLDFQEKAGNTLSVAAGLNNLGDVYEAMGKHDKAIFYNQKSLKLAKEKGNKNLMTSNYSNMGNSYLSKKEYKKALENYQIALDISRDVENSEYTAMCLSNIGEVNLLLNMPLVARDNFIKSKKISERIKSKRLIAYNDIGIGESYVLVKQFDLALPFVVEGKRLAEELELLEPQKKASELLSKIYRNKGDYKKALSSYQNFKLLNDSIFNKKNIEKITQLEYEYKYKKELESANHRELKLTKTVKSKSQDLAKSERKSFIAIIAILLVSLISGSIIFFLKLRNEKAKTQNIVVEQKLLRSQMTPHFIFNSLSVLQGMILNKESDTSLSYLSKFSKLLRTTLDNSRHKIVPLSEELIAVESYMALQNLDAKPQFTCELAVGENIDREAFLIPPMLIQPFIENAIEHAFPDPKELKKINVDIQFEAEELICTIADNGIGIDSNRKETHKEKNSLATTITEERLSLLSRDFKMKGSLKIVDRAQFGERGTLVTLIIPYKTKELV